MDKDTKEELLLGLKGEIDNHGSTGGLGFLFGYIVDLEERIEKLEEKPKTMGQLQAEGFRNPTGSSNGQV